MRRGNVDFWPGAAGSGTTALDSGHSPLLEADTQESLVPIR
jgi:hypothetical protein